MREVRVGVLEKKKKKKKSVQFQNLEGGVKSKPIFKNSNLPFFLFFDLQISLQKPKHIVTLPAYGRVWFYL